tara:strand:- start:137 stop:607 length:471 start_codon:yes stop_codon:yes gene_type:complete
MKKIKVSFDTWIQLLGMLGVLGGLIFVGLEMRQSQIIAIGNQVQARADSQLAILTTPLEGDQRLLSRFSFGSIPNESDLSEEDRLLFEQLTRIRMASLQASWQQFNLGLLPEDAWRLAERRIFIIYDSCQFRDVFERTSQPEFLEYVRSNSSSTCE